MLLKQFINTVLSGALNMLKPDVMDLCQHRVLISSEEGETNAIMDRTLCSLGVLNGTQLECDDYAQQLNFKLILFHDDSQIGDQFKMGNAIDKRVADDTETEMVSKKAKLMNSAE